MHVDSGTWQSALQGATIALGGPSSFRPISSTGPIQCPSTPRALSSRAATVLIDCTFMFEALRMDIFSDVYQLDWVNIFSAWSTSPYIHCCHVYVGHTLVHACAHISPQASCNVCSVCCFYKVLALQHRTPYQACSSTAKTTAAPFTGRTRPTNPNTGSVHAHHVAFRLVLQRYVILSSHTTTFKPAK